MQKKPIRFKGLHLKFTKKLDVDFWKQFTKSVWKMNFCLQGIPFSSQFEVKLKYKGKALKQTYKPDFICYGKIIVEIKAVKEFTNEHQAQVLNYLKATGMELGLLINFGSYPKAETKRLIWSH